jgi:hypothetical protein
VRYQNRRFPPKSRVFRGGWVPIQHFTVRHEKREAHGYDDKTFELSEKAFNETQRTVDPAFADFQFAYVDSQEAIPNSKSVLLKVCSTVSRHVELIADAVGY